MLEKMCCLLWLKHFNIVYTHLSKHEIAVPKYVPISVSVKYNKKKNTFKETLLRGIKEYYKMEMLSVLAFC